MAPIPSSVDNKAVHRVLADIGNQFELSDQKLHAITEQFVKDIQLGLSKYGEPMAVIPTYVTGVPDGSEVGTFMAVDLGGTNFRVCEVKLQGNHKFELKQKKFKITEELKTGPATALFDYMAECVGTFIEEMGTVPEQECLHLGFTFSFPVEQTALDAGTLLTWTKGFSASGAQGQDVVRLFQDSLNKKKIPVKCAALVNDTVGTLLTRGYLTGSCVLGAIFGTGTNGAYVESLSSLTKMKKDNLPQATQMIVNTEWGAFDNARTVLPLTQWDNKVDRESINPRYQAFEKLISGMYLGEIARNILLYLIDLPPAPGTSQYYLFEGRSTKQLNTHYGVDTELLSDIRGAKNVGEIRGHLVKELGINESYVSDTDAEVVAWVFDEVVKRSAVLSSCAVAAILIQSKYVKLGGAPGEKSVQGQLEIGVDGSLVEFYPDFEKTLRASLCKIVGEKIEKTVKIGLAKDGSGVGAALCALVAAKNEAAH